MAMALDGAIQFYEGDRAAGIARVRDAVSADHHVEFEYGPPWSAKPLDELLGELLLADGQRNEAATEFQKTLAVYQNRRLAREGLASCHLAAPETGQLPRTTRRDRFRRPAADERSNRGAQWPRARSFLQRRFDRYPRLRPFRMGVQIAGQPRPPMAAEASRPANRVDTAGAARIKAAVLEGICQNVPNVAVSCAYLLEYVSQSVACVFAKKHRFDGSRNPMNSGSWRSLPLHLARFGRHP
jgi:hypothetical protein